jgi:hypothetical protein
MPIMFITIVLIKVLCLRTLDSKLSALLVAVSLGIVTGPGVDDQMAIFRSEFDVVILAICF